MPKALTLQEAYDRCSVEGMFLPQKDVDVFRVQSMLRIVEEDLLTIDELKTKKRWNTLYKLSYDVLHTLAEALLYLDRKKTTNHQCLFSYLCMKRPDLDWAFFERVRTRRNGIHYYGESVTGEDWKSVKLQFDLYTKTLREEISRKLAKAL